MAQSLIDSSAENRLRFAVSLINKLKRQGVLTDVLVAASTGVQDLVDDIAAALVSGTIYLYAEPTRILVRHLLAELKFGQSIGILTDTLVAALTTVNTAAADTDLRHLFAKYITAIGYDRTDESFIEAAFGASAYTTNLT